MSWAEYEKERRALLREFTARTRKVHARHQERLSILSRNYQRGWSIASAEMEAAKAHIKADKEAALERLHAKYAATSNQENDSETTA